MHSNPLNETWATPHQTPPFGSIGLDVYAPAIREAIEGSRLNIESIANQSDAPTFANTIDRMETAT